MLSVVVPVLNEEEGLEAFCRELFRVLNDLDIKFEVLFIDDGSTDNSLGILKKLAQKYKSIRIYSFRANLGKSEALTLGFQKAKGDYVVTLDADLQDRPAEIPKMLKIAQSGTEVVCGWRKDRKDKSKMKIISKIFNKTLGYLFNLRVHDYNCGLKLYTKDAAKSLRLYGGLHRFIPLLANDQGFSVDEMVVEHQARRFGKSKYGFSKIWRDLPDMFTMLFLIKYGKRPLHFFGLVGGLLTLVGLLVLGYLTFLRFSGETIGNRPALFFGMLLVLAGFQVFFTGFLADLMIHISNNNRYRAGETLHFPIKYTNDTV